MSNFIKNIEDRFFKLSIKNILMFGFIWLFVGFSIGTLILMGPVRWIIDYSRNAAFESTTENWLIRITIILFIVGSFIISILLLKIFLKASNSFKKILIFLIPFLFSIISLWLWLNPKIMKFDSVETSEISGDIEFIFGPYPEEEKVIELKKQNITAIISLLHEAVIPFEPKLLADEIELTKKYEVNLIHLPMLPWVSENQNSLNELRKIAKEKKGKYYVHCYLGKDRVGVVKRAVAEILGEEKISGEIHQRKIENQKKFERGDVIKLEEDVYLTPYPTDEEFFAFILNGSFENIVSLLNPENPEDIPWIEKEEKLLKENHINYHLNPIKIEKFDSLKFQKNIYEIKKMNKPILIHAFLSKSPQSDKFINFYKSNISIKN